MRRFGLIGYPLSHSFSKTYFAEKFQREGVSNCFYDNFPLQTIQELPALLQANSDLEGFNITIPYKEEVLPFLADTNDVVKAIGACNCAKRNNDGRFTGYNTDVVGFRESLNEFLQPKHRKALVLGTGGSSKAVEYVLSNLSIEYKLVSRVAGENKISYDQINEDLVNEHLLIINTTPVGMYPKEDASPQIPYRFIGKHHYLFDLVYNPKKTVFLEHGEQEGAAIKNGWDMLLIQAEESWRIWNDRS